MIVSHDSLAPVRHMDIPGAKDADMKVLVGEGQGWSDHVMRLIELAPGGCSPKHAHPWPHINYMVEGHGVLHIDGKDHEVKSGSYAFVPANSLHQFVNTGQEQFRFICIVPKEGHQ